MEDLIITCIKKNEHGNIIQVGIGNELFDIETIADQIWNNKNAFFTNVMGMRVRVNAFRLPETNKPYLTTGKNIQMPNNLKFLPKCK